MSFFHLKIIIFTAFKNHFIQHGHVYVMNFAVCSVCTDTCGCKIPCPKSEDSENAKTGLNRFVR